METKYLIISGVIVLIWIAGNLAIHVAREWVRKNS